MNNEISQDDFFRHLLFCVGEEAGEIQQVIGKIGRFGLYHVSPRTNKINLENLKDEMADLITVYKMLCEHAGESAELGADSMFEKKQKVLRYYDQIKSAEGI